MSAAAANCFITTGMRPKSGPCGSRRRRATGTMSCWPCPRLDAATAFASIRPATMASVCWPISALRGPSRRTFPPISSRPSSSPRRTIDSYAVDRSLYGTPRAAGMISNCRSMAARSPLATAIHGSPTSCREPCMGGGSRPIPSSWRQRRWKESACGLSEKGLIHTGRGGVLSKRLSRTAAADSTARRASPSIGNGVLSSCHRSPSLCRRMLRGCGIRGERFAGRRSWRVSNTWKMNRAVQRRTWPDRRRCVACQPLTNLPSP